MGNILRKADGGRTGFWCPGCKGMHYIDGTWQVDYDELTVNPSVLVRHRVWTPPVTPENQAEYAANPWEQHPVDTICHSWIKFGQIQFLDDSTHDLAGQTVELTEIPE